MDEKGSILDQITGMAQQRDRRSYPFYDETDIGRFFLDKEKVVIALVDIQERLAASMDMREKVVTNILHLLEAAKLFALPVVLTEQYPKGLGRTVEEIRDALTSYQPIEKVTFSCCRISGFMDTLASSGRKKVILCGMETHVCVLQTCLDLISEGYMTHVVGDAVCSRMKDTHEKGLAFMRDAGAVITFTETALFQLLEKAGTEEFRTISKRIK
jgi:nicotinamidase-related amidase